MRLGAPFFGGPDFGLGMPVGGAGAASFRPTDLSGCQLWLRADLGVAKSGNNVTSWADQSGHGNNATAVSTPQYNATGGPASRPSIDLGSGQYFTHGLVLPKPGTVVAVAKTSGAGYCGLAMFGKQGGGFAGICVFAKVTSGNWGLYQNADVSSSVAIATYKRLVALVTDYNSVDLRTDGTSEHVVTGVSAYAPDTNCLIGTGLAGSQYLTGSIAELAAYNRVLSVDECKRVEAYLHARYGL